MQSDNTKSRKGGTGWRPGPSAIIPLIGVAIMVGGSVAALLGAGDGAWVVAVLGLFVVLIAFGF